MKVYIAFGLAMLVVISLWIVNLIVVPLRYPTYADNGTTRPYSVESPGIFGDMFGGLNALFTGLSLSGVVIAIISQAEQQRKQQKEEIESQNRALQTAKFQEAAAQIQQKTVELQEASAKSQQIQADALTKLAKFMSTEGRRRHLQFQIKYKTELCDKFEAIKAASYSHGTQQQKNHDDAVENLRHLRIEIEAHNKALAELGGEENS